MTSHPRNPLHTELQPIIFFRRFYRGRLFNIKTNKEKNVGIYPETKTPKWFKDELPEYTMEDLMIETISKFEFESEHVILQSFSTQSLLYLSQELKTDLRLIQLTNIPITDDQLKD